jgi:RNA recognition motif-containing protein
MENKLFVGNLPWAATESDIRAHFSQAGEVTSVEVMMDKFTGRPRGFAFVTMASAQAAQDAIAKTENIDFMGRPLKVNVARPREERRRPWRLRRRRLSWRLRRRRLSWRLRRRRTSLRRLRRRRSRRLLILGLTPPTKGAFSAPFFVPG